jgi:hypothetical protein
MRITRAVALAKSPMTAMRRVQQCDGRWCPPLAVTFENAWASVGDLFCGKENPKWAFTTFIWSI